jgi:hypothetical protein
VRRALAIALTALLGFAFATWLAGEQTEVAVLRTFDDAGAAYDTKMWIADVDGHAYVRIARPGREWGERLRAHPAVELVRGGVAKPCTATVVADPALHRAVDDAFATKYGWVDWWYGVVLRRDPVPVQLDPR